MTGYSVRQSQTHSAHTVQPLLLPSPAPAAPTHLRSTAKLRASSCLQVTRSQVQKFCWFGTHVHVCVCTLLLLLLIISRWPCQCYMIATSAPQNTHFACTSAPRANSTAIVPQWLGEPAAAQSLRAHSPPAWWSAPQSSSAATAPAAPASAASLSGLP